MPRSQFVHPRACIIKLIVAIPIVFVIVSHFLLVYTNTLALYDTAVNKFYDKGTRASMQNKKVNNFGTRGMYYKTFYGHI